MTTTEPSGVLRLNRRAFLSRGGRGSLAIAILGPSFIAACSSDGELSSTPATSAEPTTPEEPSQSRPDLTASNSPENLRWERVSMGFVSAYLLTRGSAVTIVDSGTAGNQPLFDAALATLGASWSDVSNVILTHKHGDHIGGLPSILAAASGASVYIGEADIGALTDVEANPLRDGDEVFGLEVIATPGHTPGHISVFDSETGFLVAGDALNEENGMILGPNPDFSSDMDQANQSVIRLSERSYETAVFGHGNPIESRASDAVVALAQTI